MTILEKREQRAKLVANARKLVDQAEAENRSMTAEENEAFDRYMGEVDRLASEVESDEKQIEMRSKLEASEQALKTSRSRRTIAIQPGDLTFLPADEAAEFRSRFGHVTRSEYAQLELRYSPEYRAAFARYLNSGARGADLIEAEYRDLQAGADTQGGYLMAPVQFVDELIAQKKNLVFIRKLAKQYTVTAAQGLGAPSLEVDISAPVWTSEIATANEDTAMRFGKRELYPHPLAKLTKISNKLLRVNAASAEGTVRDRLGYQFAITEENAFLNGTGAEQPLGVFVASSTGIDTTRDVTTATVGTIGADDLIETKYALKQQYLDSETMRWVMHRTVVKLVRKLKDSEGQYLWTTGLGIGQPDTLLDVPIAMSEYAPNAVSSGDYVAVLGDFQYYWIAETLNLTIHRLNELYAATNQVGFIGREEVDGMPVLAEAFVRLKVQ